MAKKAQPEDSFRRVIDDVLRALRMTRVELAGRMGVSARALQHWYYEAGPPPERTAHRVLAGLRDLEPSLFRRLAASMGIVAEERATDPAARTMARADAKRALDATLHASSEDLDVSAKRVRIAALALLSRITELGIDVPTAQSLLAEGTSKGRG